MAEDLTGQTLLGKYRIVELLGQGGMGTVWRATHVRTGRKLAIKVLDERFLSSAGIVQRFGREARAASAIQHPGIVEVLDLDQTAAGVPFLVMELLEGETLAKRIQRVGRLSQEETVLIMTQLLQALDAAHEHGVVHRDLKPDNVVLVPWGQGETVKILDFGISQKEDERVANLTLAGSVLGTPHYMAPEQALGESDVDRRADVYAAAVVMYECVVGDVPFDAPNYNKLIQIILRDEPVPPTERGAAIDPGVEEVILGAMAKSRDQRPQTAGAMLEMLQAVTSDATAPFDRETLGFVRQGRPPTGSVSRKALAATMAEQAAAEPPPEGAAAESAPYPDLPELDLPELDLSPPPARSSAPARAPSSPPVPLGPGPDENRGFGPLDDLGGDAAAGAPLDLDESALARPSRAPVAAPPAPVDGDAPAARSSAPSLPPGRSRSYGRLLAAPSSAPPPKDTSRTSRAILYGVGAVALIALVVVGLRMLVRPGEDAPPEAPPPVHIQPDEEPVRSELPMVRVDVEGLPEGARLRLDGLPVGRPPLRVRAGTRHRLEVVAPGFEPETLEFVADGDTQLSVRMRRAEEE